MPTWKDLWKQRLRWKRGAVENCFQYGITGVTWKYWARQLLTFIGVIITILYLSTIGYCLVTWQWNIAPIWIVVTIIFMIERAVTVRAAGIKQMLLSLTMYEIVIDFFLQAVHAKAFWDAALNKRKEW